MLAQQGSTAAPPHDSSDQDPNEAENSLPRIKWADAHACKQMLSALTLLTHPHQAQLHATKGNPFLTKQAAAPSSMFAQVYFQHAKADLKLLTDYHLQLSREHYTDQSFVRSL